VGLGRFFWDGNARGINAQHATWLGVVLTTLNAATRSEQMNLPGARLHQL